MTYLPTDRPDDFPEEEQVDIDMSAAEDVVLPEGTPPPLPRVARWTGPRPPRSGDPIVILHQTALEMIEKHSLSNTYVELGGCLLGSAYQHDGQIYVEVSAAVVAHSDENGPVHFTFTADAWASMHAERERSYPQLEIVGWYHTHPNLGVFYSADDVVVHATAFQMAWHVGLVVDPIRREACVFGWQRDTGHRTAEPQPLRGYYELADMQPEPLVDWRYTHSYGMFGIRDDILYGSGLVPGQPAGALAPVRQQPLSRLSLMLATGLAMALLLFFATVLPLRIRNGQLEQVALSLADERLAVAEANGLASCSDETVRIYAPEPGSQFTVGERVPVLGRAQDAEAWWYRLEVRPVDGSSWREIRSVWYGRSFGQLASWDTSGLQPGQYELLLRTDRRADAPQPTVACVVIIELLPAPAETLDAEATLIPTADPAGLPAPEEVPTP